MIEEEAEKPPRPLFQRFWFWMLVCLLFVGPALLSTGPVPLEVIAHAIFLGWIPFVAQAVLWKVARMWVTSHQRQRALCFLVPVICAGWLLFDYSSFYGRPRKIIGAALKEPAPLVFWPVEFTEDNWTDYTAELRVHIDRDYLRRALEKHFVRFSNAENPTHSYHWKDAEFRDELCEVETDAQYSYAKIIYGVD
jgi:hypothetical protein